MSRHFLTIFLFVLGTAPQVSAGSEDRALPSTWFGVWSGEITVYSTRGEPFNRPMEIQISPVRDGKVFTWKVTSSMNGEQSVRDYELVPSSDKPGNFKLDEKNGILLNTRLMGNTLHTYFKDGDILITSRYERRGESLYVEMASVTTKDPLVSEIKEANIAIQSYELGSVQTGELKRKK